MQRKSTVGLTVDFPLLNVLGFTCYTTSTAAFLFNRTIRHQYAVRNPHAPVPTVRPNDFAFALHALIICLVTASQLWSRLWGFEVVPGRRATRFTQCLFLGSIAGVLIIWITVAILDHDRHDPSSWAEIDVVGTMYTHSPSASLTALADLCNLIHQADPNHLQIRTAGHCELQGAVDTGLVNYTDTAGYHRRRAQQRTVVYR